MLSPDNFVQNPGYAQNFNRYSYAYNNPLKYTDPDGEFITWSISASGFSIGYNFTPVGVPLGAGINVGWKDGGAVGVYVEAAYRVGGTGMGIGGGVSQSLDYHFNGGLSTTTSESVYGSIGPLTFSYSMSQTYNMSNRSWNHDWGVSAGIGGGDEEFGAGFSISYGSSGKWSLGAGGFFDPGAATVYRSPVDDNFGGENGECALRCFEEFAESYNMPNFDYEYWLEQNGGVLGVSPWDVEGIVNNSGVFSSNSILSNPNEVVTAFQDNKRVMMGFQTETGGAHAVMINKIKVYKSGKYRVYFKETSPGRIAPYTSTNFISIPGSRLWTFYPND
jgi:hypothetical protein